MVKIDRSFAASVGTQRSAARMFEAVLGVVRAAELQAVAEGIEATPQLDVLVRMGCESGQGFLFARPAPPDEIATWLAAQTQNR